jgi:hypothetical protein
MPVQYLTLAICQGLTFLFLGSNICKANPLLQEIGGIDYPDTCAISTGAKYSISSTVFFLLGALSSFIELIMARESEEAGESEEAANSDIHTSLLQHDYP